MNKQFKDYMADIARDGWKKRKEKMSKEAISEMMRKRANVRWIKKEKVDKVK